MEFLSSSFKESTVPRKDRKNKTPYVPPALKSAVRSVEERDKLVQENINLIPYCVDIHRNLAYVRAHTTKEVCDDLRLTFIRAAELWKEGGKSKFPHYAMTAMRHALKKLNFRWKRAIPSLLADCHGNEYEIVDYRLNREHALDRVFSILNFLIAKSPVEYRQIIEMKLLKGYGERRIFKNSKYKMPHIRSVLASIENHLKATAFRVKEELESEFDLYL